MHYRGAGVPVWHIKAIITVYFVVMWSLESSLLYESSWGMMLDTISLSYSAPGANSFSFCSKVEFCCVNFFLLCASWIWPSLPWGCCCWTLSKLPMFCPAVFNKFFTIFWEAFYFCAILVLFFPWFVFFLEAVDDDAFAFSITPNTSVCAHRLRNLSHSADALPATIFMSPLLSPCPYLLLSPLMSSSPVLLCSSFLSSEFSGNFDEDDSLLSPLWIFFLVVFGIVEHGVFTFVYAVIFPVVLTTSIVFVNGGDVFCWS